MSTVYEIRDWGLHYENNRTRELKHLDWVPMPNKHDGDGYRELVCGHPNGAAHYGAWCAMVQVASKCDPRGTLLRDSRTLLRDGARPHDADSLERKTGIPAAVWSEAIPRMVKVGWLLATDCSATIPQEGAGSLRESRTPLRKSASEGKGMEGKGTEVCERGVYPALLATGKMPNLTPELLAMKLRLYPKADTEAGRAELVESARSVTGTIGNPGAWIDSNLQRIEAAIIGRPAHGQRRGPQSASERMGETSKERAARERREAGGANHG